MRLNGFLDRVGVPVGLATVGLGLLVLCGCAPAEELTPPEYAKSDVGNQREYDYNVKLAVCIEEKGWDVDVDGAGGWGIVYKPSDLDPSLAAAKAAADACRSALGTGLTDLTEENANYAFSNNLRVADCLEKNGYETVPAPDRDTFVQRFMDGDEMSDWIPYEAIPVEMEAAAVFTCPQ